MKAEVNIRTAVSKIGTVGEVSMKRLKIQVAAIITILIRAVWKPNAVPLKLSGYRVWYVSRL